jgi:hypothetical protein
LAPLCLAGGLQKIKKHSSNLSAWRNGSGWRLVLYSLIAKGFGASKEFEILKRD